MELLYFFQACKRYFLTILSISLLIALASGIFWEKFVPVEHKTTIFLSTVTKVDDKRINDRFDPLSYVESADRFAEGILGWFRNPSFFEYIKKSVPEAEDMKLDRMYQIRKQEKQNLNITFQVGSKELAFKLQEATVRYLKEQVANINKQSNTTFDIINDTFIIMPVKYNPLLIAGLVFALSFIVLVFAFLSWEVIRGIASVRTQVEDILGTTALDTVHGAKADMGFIANTIAKSGQYVAIGGVGKSVPAYFKSIAHYLADNLGRETIVVDVDLEHRALGTSFGLSDTMKKMKGITDFDDDTADITKISLPIDKEKNLLKYIGAGTGSIPHYAFLEKNLPADALVLLNMELPKDTHIFQMKNISLILFVQLGVTKLLDLQRIKKLMGDTQVNFVIVD